MPSIKKNLTVRLDDDTREVLELISDRELRTLANQIVVFVRKGIDAYLFENDLSVRTILDPENNVEARMLEKKFHSTFDDLSPS